MGMSIEDSIDLFEDNFTAINTHGHYTEEEEIQATKIAIATMRKYQKIEQIISEWTTNMNVNTTMAMCEIEEVVEDGKINEGEQP